MNVANALAAQQWELHLAADSLGSGARAWETPPLKPYAAWLDEIWLEHAGERGPALSTNQSLALWRRVQRMTAFETSRLIGPFKPMVGHHIFALGKVRR